MNLIALARENPCSLRLDIRNDLNPKFAYREAFHRDGTIGSRQRAGQQAHHAQLGNKIGGRIKLFARRDGSTTTSILFSGVLRRESRFGVYAQQVNRLLKPTHMSTVCGL